MIKQENKRNVERTERYETEVTLHKIKMTAYLASPRICQCIYIPSYPHLSHALKNTANQKPGLPLHILQYGTGSIAFFFPVIS